MVYSGTSGTPSPTQEPEGTASPPDAFSGMVTKKGRFGTDPYINFLKKGTVKTKPSPIGRG